MASVYLSVFGQSEFVGIRELNPMSGKSPPGHPARSENRTSIPADLPVSKFIADIEGRSQQNCSGFRTELPDYVRSAGLQTESDWKRKRPPTQNAGKSLCRESSGGITDFVIFTPLIMPQIVSEEKGEAFFFQN